MIFPGVVLKRDHALTFLATIGIDPPAMKFLAVISILALLTMSGAAISDQFLTADQHANARGGIARRAERLFVLGETATLSIDQFLRFISVPALFAAFIIASQISAALSQG